MTPFKFYSATKLGKQPTEVKKTLQPVPDDESNLEAENGEVVVTSDDSGLPAAFTVAGKRHYAGGTKLNLAPNSFIFSRDKSMRITDPTILSQFNMAASKSGYTPAEIAKKYDINNYRKVLADKNTDKLQRDTAESMIANYNEKLAKLSLIQESHKGFPNGIPMIAQPYLHSSGMNPAEIFGAQDQDAGDQEEPDEEQARFGGQPKFNFFKKGGEETLRRVRVVAPGQMKAQLGLNVVDPLQYTTTSGYEPDAAWEMQQAQGYHGFKEATPETRSAMNKAEWRKRLAAENTPLQFVKNEPYVENESAKAKQFITQTASPKVKNSALDDLGTVDAEHVATLVKEGYHFKANGKIY